MDKKSPHYVKSTTKMSLYGNENTTVYERSMSVKGKSSDTVRSTAEWVKDKAMP